MIRSFLYIAFVALCMCACSGSYENEDYTGTLYFAWGQTLYAMNLQNRHVMPIYKNSMMVMTSLEELDDQHLLLGYYALGRGEFGMAGEQIVNLASGTASAYAAPLQIQSLRYLPELKVVVFFRLVGSSHWSLYWANVDTPLQSHLIDDTETSGSIVIISVHQVIYTVGIPGGGLRLKAYDFETHLSSFLSITNCNPIVWRSHTDQLVCLSDDGSGNYYLVRLDGSDRERIDLGWINRGLYMVAYIKKYDTAVMTGYGGIWFSLRRGFYEVSDLYFYKFNTKKLISISNRYSANASLGTAVWHSSE